MHRPIIFNLIFLLLTAPAQAITDQERAQIELLRNELVMLAKLIDVAEQAVNPLDRHQIQYPALRADLQKIQQGLSDVLTARRREPRNLPPIEGAYH